MSKVPKIHVWMPDIFQFKGGIQVYSAFFIQAIERILPDSDRHIFLKNDAKSTDDLQSNPDTKFQFAGQWKYSWLHTPVFAFQVFLAALQERPDLIICGHINFSPLALQIFKLLKIPYWVIVHGIDAWDIKEASKISALKAAEKILSVSEYTSNHILIDQENSLKNIHILSNTFNASQFIIQSKPQYLLDRYQLDKNQPIILTVARLAGGDRYKGYDQIIQSLPIIRQQIPNIHYLLVGKGDDRDRVEAIIDSTNVRDCVTLTGFVSDEELGDHYNLCDVFAMPSKGEGFGIVYLEALACGKPTIGGNQDGAIDALCHGKLGALVDPDDIQELAETIISILQGTYPNSLIYKPQALRQAVIDTFGLEQFQKTLATYLENSF
ncbi:MULTISPECIES: glycosyltransferase family 4 protein [Aphanizomenonaceae]|uniref:Glycosyltransferase family 4 protein n=1 Tax=Dolichospermum flos-aquae LEGE 04289 TaxID=1828708 RepID=A0ACC5Q420_DOLFA|nr:MULTISPECIES: glycosyltransferase family 4 protein [Aphanizomenonaceae]MBE9220268.1 glycosyltransferase family 4 protein [Dolichospermum flos-aquae LEGE 04289]MTJ32267.1 glycosyltransferase family 4 protein [Aphanizomenon sp. UHCC 0183]